MTTNVRTPGLHDGMVAYPLTAQCAYCGCLLQFDIDPGGTPGRNGDWGAVSDYGSDYGCGEHPKSDENGTWGHVPTGIRWEVDAL